MLTRPTLLSIGLMLFVLYTTGTTASDELPDGPYLGQQPPGTDPVLFAPGIVSDELNNRDLAMLPDGSEIYFSINSRNFDLSTILVSYRGTHGWSKPVVAPFARDKRFRYLEPAISPDGAKFFFVATERDHNNNDIWVMDRSDGQWGEAKKLGKHINTDVSETFPSITKDGTLYFSRASENPRIEHIYRSRMLDGEYTRAERLPENVNSGQTQFNAFVAPDESYLIVPVWGREDSIGSVDYYIVFRNENDEWSQPINMGEQINTPGGTEYSAFVSRDGKYLFFMSSRLPADNSPGGSRYSLEELRAIHMRPRNGNSDIYWVDAGIIETLRPEGF